MGNGADTSGAAGGEARVASAPALLSLHGVRILGGPTVRSVAALFALDPARVESDLLDAEAYGWVTRYRFEAIPTWSLTDRGRVENERQLADELDRSGVRPVIARVNEDFGPLNERLTAACTAWQVRPVPGDTMASNDHTDHRWDDRVIDELRHVGRRLETLTAALTGALPRMGVHGPRFATALGHVLGGETRWIDAPELASCHLVWIQLHEDLLATSGTDRARGH